MKRVVFGGSRKLGKLNNAIREHADNIIAKKYLVLIGDANGADRAMQEYLAQKNYPHVLVFCAGSTCRNNIGGWETRLVPTGRAHKDFQHYVIRDKQMAKEADYGFMVWDGKSKGTLNQIANLIEIDKPVLVYFSPKKRSFTLKAIQDLADLLSLCEREAIELLENSLKLSHRINSEQLRLNLA